MWLGEVLLPELERHGLRKGWALDVGCGTGRAFEPLLDRGWEVVGCDLSPGMLAEAERKFGSRVQLFSSDARELPPVRPSADLPDEGAFQLVLLLNDVINYLTEDGDLEQAFAGVKRNLSRDRGLAILDANTLGIFRAAYASDVTEAREDWQWQGLAAEVKPEGTYEGRFTGRGVETHVHRQRHWTTDQVKEAMEAAGLRCLAALGQREEGSRVLLSDPPNEERDAKIIYVAAHSD
jgi:SAM-dependent methyltransferase